MKWNFVRTNIRPHVYLIYTVYRLDEYALNKILRQLQGCLKTDDNAINWITGVSITHCRSMNRSCLFTAADGEKQTMGVCL